MELFMPDFVQGILVALLPSMLTVAWFVWRATPSDSDFTRRSLDRHV
jgi:hypothetical protein